MPKRAKIEPSLFDEVGIAVPHPFVATDIRWFESVLRSGPKPPWFDTMWTPRWCRTLRIQDTLLKAIDKRPRFRVDTKPDTIRHIELVVYGERIRYAIGEYVVRSSVPLMKSELRKAAKSGQKTRYKIVETPTGKLYVSATGVYRGIGSGCWSDEPGRPLEAQVETILLGLEAIAAEISAQRAKELEEEQRAEAQRAERRRPQEIEQSRWDNAWEMADAWQEAERMRRLIGALEKRMPLKPHQASKLAKWLRWARARVDNLDPLTNDIDVVLARLGFE